MECKIIIPSKGRASTIVAHKYVANAIICVEESEEGIYREHNPTAEIVTHPDSIIGLPDKREWIYDKFGDVFMFDDDIKGLSKITVRRGESNYISPEKVYWLIQNAANLAKLCGCYLFSFNNLKRPEFYSGHNPYKLSGTINGCAFGILKGADKLRVDKKIKLGYEFYISGINAYYYRKAFFDLRYFINQNDFAEATGGAANQRTKDNERKDLELLKEYFGDAIIERAKGTKAVKCEYSKYLKIPY